LVGEWKIVRAKSPGRRERDREGKETTLKQRKQILGKRSGGMAISSDHGTNPGKAPLSLWAGFGKSSWVESRWGVLKSPRSVNKDERVNESSRG
jgi:hypothetical protein